MSDTSHPVSWSDTTMAELTTPTDTNRDGTLHGGALLRMIDRAAAVCAMRHAGGNVVTASVDQVDFHTPIYIGNLVTLRARVNWVGNSSMEIGIQVTAEEPRTKETTHTNTCYLTFVKIDENRKPVRVPRLELETEEDRTRWAEAEERRKTRIRG
jgi:uncharacterized protein (TIGR00369 family)